MRSLHRAILLLIAAVAPSVSQTSPHSVSRHFGSECSDVAGVASAYLSSHGIFVYDERRARDLSIVGIDAEPLAPGKVARKPKKWRDAQGNEITDLKVYWTYADKKTGETSQYSVFGVSA